VSRVPARSAQTKLIVLRGNSASGKSTVAAEIRRLYGRGIAIVGQDNLRRVVLREHDVPGGANVGLIDTVARYALGHGYHVILEGILYAAHYGDMLDALRASHHSRSWFYYLDISFEETLRRHATKPQASEYGHAEMSSWYREHDTLPRGYEQIIGEDAPLDAIVQQVMDDTGLTREQALPRQQARPC
jgi:hypothetical protein